MNALSRASLLLFAALIVALGHACSDGKTVYVKRGAGFLGLEGNIGDERVLDDGTRVIIVDEIPSRAQSPGDGAAVRFVEPTEPTPVYTGGPLTMSAVPTTGIAKPKQPEPEEFLPRKELGGGRIEFRAIMPEHVMSNLIESLRNREYSPFYEQMLSDEARASYEQAGGVAKFEEWAEANREPLLIFLNRMSTGWSGSDVIPKQVTKMRLRYSLDRRNIPKIRFEYVEISLEHGGCRLAMIN